MTSQAAPAQANSDADAGALLRPRAIATLSSLRMLVWMAVVLPLLAYATVGYYRYHQLRAETAVRLDRSLRIAQEHALKVLDTTESLLARVQDVAGDGTNVERREPELHRQLRAMARRKPQLQGVWVFGPNGVPVASSRFSPPPAVDVRDRDYFRHHQAGRGGLYVSEPLVSRSTGDPFFDVSIGLRNGSGDFAGLVSVSLLSSYFVNFHDELSADEPGLAITMLREDGAIFSRYPPLPNAPPRLAANSPVMSRIKAGQTQGVADGVSSVDGRERLLRFSQVGSYPIYLGTGMDVAVIRQRWLGEMAWLAAFGLPPLLGLWYAARMALRRTRDALDAADRLGEETQARRRVEEALLQSQKLEALGRLTGGVAHDFNNALMVISNNLFLLKRKHPEADGPQAAAIGRAIGSATQLTRQLLAFSRRQALVPEHVVLHTRVPGLADLLGPVLGGQVALSIEVAPDAPPVRVDAAEFELALLNLAINSRDAMPTGGRFVLRARLATEDLPALLQGPHALIEAVDTGVGIEADKLDKVFEPFYTTKPLGQGTGLGLSQVYGLCQRAGGTATVDSRPGHGTTVRLYLPAADPASAEPLRAPAVQGAPLALRLLLVEDNDEVAGGLTPVLEALGCTVTRLDRAGEARDWLARQDLLPDVLLTDVVMPGEMDGMALAQQVRAHYPSVKVVVMTGYAEHIDAIARLGFEILPKPCSPDMLAEAMRRVGAMASSQTPAASA